LPNQAAGEALKENEEYDGAYFASCLLELKAGIGSAAWKLEIVFNLPDCC